jgi:hypothetical protein
LARASWASGCLLRFVSAAQSSSRRNDVRASRTRDLPAYHRLLCVARQIPYYEAGLVKSGVGDGSTFYPGCNAGRRFPFNCATRAYSPRRAWCPKGSSASRRAIGHKLTLWFKSFSSHLLRPRASCSRRSDNLHSAPGALRRGKKPFLRPLPAGPAWADGAGRSNACPATSPRRSPINAG